MSITDDIQLGSGCNAGRDMSSSSCSASQRKLTRVTQYSDAAAEAASVSVRPAGSTKGGSDGMEQKQGAEVSHDQSHGCHGDMTKAVSVCISGSAHMTELKQEVIILDPDDLEEDSFEDNGPPVTIDIHTVDPGVWEEGRGSDDLTLCCGSGGGGGGGGEGKVRRTEGRSVGGGVLEEEGWGYEEGGWREEEEWEDKEENEEAFPEFDSLVGEFDSAEDFFTQVTNTLHFECNSNHC